MNEKNLRRNQTLLWSGVGICLLILLYILSPVLTPFMLALALAYILAPGVELLVRLHLPRWLAVFFMVFLLFAVLLGIMLIIIPLLRREINLVIGQLPIWVHQYNTQLAPNIDEWLGVDSKLDISRIRLLLQDAVTGTDSLFTTALNYLKASGSTLVFYIASGMLTPVVLVYLLFDWNTFLHRFSEIIPRRFLNTALDIGNEIDKLLSSFLRGQILVMLILAVYYSVGLSIADFDSAIPIGVITGLLVFIPYLGFGLGLLLAILSALLQFEGYYGLIAVAIVFGIGQVFESLYLTPKIMGDRIGLHPLVIIFALFVFGEIFGFFGVLLALPISAALSVLVRRVYGQYLNSTFYKNE